MHARWAARSWGVGLIVPEGYRGPFPVVFASGKLGTPFLRMQAVKRVSAWR